MNRDALTLATFPLDGMRIRCEPCGREGRYKCSLRIGFGSRPAIEVIDARVLRMTSAPAEAATRGVGAFAVDGRLLDGPFITRAARTLSIARRLGILQG
jgi:hypothetical protein